MNRLNTDQFVNQQQLDLSRARRVWEYFTVIIVAWASFAVVFPVLGCFETVIHHVCVLVCFAIIFFWFRNEDLSSSSKATWITNSYLTVHSIGIFLNPMVCPVLESSLFALPFGTTIAFVLLGRRAAIPWLLVSLLAFIAYPIMVHGLAGSLPGSPIFMDTILKCGATFAIFVCFCNFDTFYQRRNKQLVELSRSLNTLATTDSLTGLSNRFQCNKNLTQAIKEASRDGSKLGLLVLDMDGFKQINDTYGHSVGDEGLIEIAARLKKFTKGNTKVARLGGDEFCVLIRDVSDRQQVEKLAKQLHKSLCREYLFASTSCQLGASIGIALFPADAKSPEKLLAYADTAMYHAKENHLPFAHYDTKQTIRVARYNLVQTKLSKALENEEFFLEYQPQIDIQSGRVIGAEALLRWNHNGKVIPPYKFISYLESSRRITEVTGWILEEVCDQIHRWNEAGLRMKVAVNISAIDFHCPDFVDVVNAVISQTKIDARLLELEITEGVLIKDVDTVADKMKRLKATGLTISIDDFGTGYSSLAYIRSLPIDKLKIDREFIKGIPDTDDGAIASSIVLLSKTLGFEVLAEGVETQTQLDYLRSADCDQFQGYLASRPISATDLQSFALRTNQPSGQLI